MGTGIAIGGPGPNVGPPISVGPPLYPFAPGHPWFAAKLPNGDELAKAVRLNPGRFPDRDWDADFRSWLTLIEFAATDWRAEVKVDQPPDFGESNKEIDELLALATQRADAMDEILAQHNNFPQYFMGLLLMTPASHPATYLVMRTALRVAEMVMVHYKALFNRQRPAQICPVLLPPIETQGHAAYPSGHSLQAHLLAWSISEVYPPAKDVLLALADRIAFNREIAGFHYRSDTIAGERIAEQVFGLLQPLPTFMEIIGQARQEWK